MRRSVPVWRCTLAVAAAAVLGGCGSSPAASPSPPDEAHRTAAQIYSDALTAVSSQSSVHVVGHVVDAAGSAVDVDVEDTKSAARVAIRPTTGGVIYLVVTPESVYGAQNPAGPYQMAPSDLATEARSLTIESTVRCARIEHGTLTRGGVSTVDGVRVVAVDDDGRAPGAAPSTVYVALSGPPLIVRVVQHGTTTAGGRLDCGHASSQSSTPPTVRATFDYKDWGQPLTITPPPSGVT